MRKLFILFVVATLFLALPAAAPALCEASGVNLSIDDQNVYEGMDRAYQSGYVPQVKDGYATVIVPLLADGPIKNNTIIATPGLGEAASSAFVIKNYQKTIGLAQNNVNGGSTQVASYLVRFDMQLKDGRLNGNYPVTINVQAQGMDGSTVQQSFTSYVTIADGAISNDSQPKIIVSDSSTSPSTITAGGAFTVRITIKNTSNTQPVKNIMVIASCDSQNLSLQNDSDTLVVGNIGAGKTTTIKLTYKSDIDTPEQQYKISLAISYEDANAASLSSGGTVSFRVHQSMRVDMKMPLIAQQVNAGDTLPLSFQVMNMGRSKVFNVRVELSAAGLFPTSTAFVGNMEAGTAATSEMDVFIGTKDMTEGYAGGEKYGQTNGVITLIYEDAGGKEYTATMQFNTTINKPVIAQTPSEPKEEPKKAGQWWISLIIGVAITAGLLAWLIIRNKRRVNDL